MLYDSYSGAIFSIIFGIIKRNNESEELLHTVFLKVWNNIDSYDQNKGTLFTWMAQIARNAALDLKRLKSFEKVGNTESFTLHEHDSYSTLTTQDIDLKKITDKIPEKYKVILDKIYLEGYTHQELADELNIPLGTVKSRLREGVNLLRQSLKNERHLLYMFINF
jgi:RNA polymerase sigma-70 factor (ECF subfamily)